jgi:hypothetical protein
LGEEGGHLLEGTVSGFGKNKTQIVPHRNRTCRHPGESNQRGWGPSREQGRGLPPWQESHQQRS